MFFNAQLYSCIFLICILENTKKPEKQKNEKSKALRKEDENSKNDFKQWGNMRIAAFQSAQEAALSLCCSSFLKSWIPSWWWHVVLWMFKLYKRNVRKIVGLQSECYIFRLKVAQRFKHVRIHRLLQWICDHMRSYIICCWWEVRYSVRFRLVCTLTRRTK